MTLSRAGRLDVDLTRAIEDEEWPGLLDAILRAAPILDRVVFLFPSGFDAKSHARALSELLQALEARGITTERRHAPKGRLQPDREQCPACGSTKVVLQGRVFDGRPIRELLCLSCKRTQRVEIPPERGP
jgi:hypothetical protein